MISHLGTGTDTIYIQPKKQFKVQIIGILEEIDSFIDQKCTYENVLTNLGRALPPPHLDKRTAGFPHETVPYVRKIF